MATQLNPWQPADPAWRARLPTNPVVRSGPGIGFPYESRLRYADSNINEQPVVQGSRGKVIGISYYDGYDNYLVEITLPYEKPQRTAWIHRSHIHIGTKRLYGDIYYQHIDTPLNIREIPPRNYAWPFARALDGLYLAFRENADKLAFLPPRFIAIVEDPEQRHSLINTIITGMDQKVIDVLNKPNFTVRDILSVTRDVQEAGKEDTRYGIYLITYRKKEAPRLTYQYGGKTAASGGFVGRGKQHGSATTANTKSNHYKAAYDADRVIAAICHVPDSDDARQYVEQTVVSLFELYCPAVLHYQPVLVRKDMDVSEAETEVAKWSLDHEQASMLSNLATASFLKSGWPGACSRDSYGCDGGGLNWKSPIAEGGQHEQTIYTVVRIPRHNIDLYHRPAVRVTQGTSKPSEPKKISLMQENQKIKVKGGYGKFHPVIGGAGPSVDTWVNPVFEVMRDGTPHSKSWARLPDVGAWDNFFWNFARSWALRIDWQQGSQWRSFYVQADHVLIPRKGQYAVASHNTFAQGIAVANFLTRRWMVSNSPMPSWFYDYRVARLKEQKFDWLEQTYTLRDEDRLVDIGTPKQRSLRDIGAQLQALGLNVGNWQQWDHSSGDERVCCDCCYITHIRKREFDATTGIAMDTLPRGLQQAFRSCDRFAGTNRCTPCYNRGLPCSWTFSLRTAQLNDPRVKAFRPVESAPGAVLDTAEPDLIRVSPQHIG